MDVKTELRVYATQKEALASAQQRADLLQETLDAAQVRVLPLLLLLLDFSRA